eukprot:COSAG02_NODE_1375_length_13001_cov_3.495272_1_plen_46_part_00
MVYTVLIVLTLASAPGASILPANRTISSTYAGAYGMSSFMIRDDE